MRSIAVVLVFLMGVFGVAGADQRFRSVPAAGKGRTPLQLKVVAYDGATNGELTVEVRNPTGKPLRFAAEGLYFIPDGDPDTAPQRLGAVGPLRLASSEDEDARRSSIAIAAGATVRVKLDVFCIDSHRPSPSSDNTFALGSKRLPRNLTATIEKRSADAAAGVSGSYAAPAAKSAIQGIVWTARDAKWVELEGEGDQEAGK